ncbi:MAG TPA: hypothetical protein VMR74_13875 [Gammaproteobacteria bacterium]|nr:hypothetical protein [Gammaproteobacteria bacterium]
MTTHTASSRRRFFFEAGAALSAPLAVGTAWASAADGGASRSMRADELGAIEAIRRLEQKLAQHIRSRARDEMANLFVDPAGAESVVGIRHLAPADFGERDVINLAADGHSARIQLPCEIEIESEIEAEGTLAEMARLQGDGLLRRQETCTLEADLVVHGGAWRFRRLLFR